MLLHITKTKSSHTKNKNYIIRYWSPSTNLSGKTVHKLVIFSVITLLYMNRFLYIKSTNVRDLSKFYIQTFS